MNDLNNPKIKGIRKGVGEEALIYCVGDNEVTAIKPKYKNGAYGPIIYYEIYKEGRLWGELHEWTLVQFF